MAAAIGLGSGLVLLRTGGLTLLMLTLCTMALLEEAANLAHDYTGGFDGLDSLPIAPLLGRFEFNPLYPTTQYLYVLAVLFVCFVFVRTLVYSPFGQSLTGIRENTLRMHAVGAPVRKSTSPDPSPIAAATAAARTRPVIGSFQIPRLARMPTV